MSMDQSTLSDLKLTTAGSGGFPGPHQDQEMPNLAVIQMIFDLVLEIKVLGFIHSLSLPDAIQFALSKFILGQKQLKREIKSLGPVLGELIYNKGLLHAEQPLGVLYTYFARMDAKKLADLLYLKKLRLKAFLALQVYCLKKYKARNKKCSKPILSPFKLSLTQRMTQFPPIPATNARNKTTISLLSKKETSRSLKAFKFYRITLKAKLFYLLKHEHTSYTHSKTKADHFLIARTRSKLKSIFYHLSAIPKLEALKLIE